MSPGPHWAVTDICRTFLILCVRCAQPVQPHFEMRALGEEQQPLLCILQISVLPCSVSTRQNENPQQPGVELGQQRMGCRWCILYRRWKTLLRKWWTLHTTWWTLHRRWCTLHRMPALQRIHLICGRLTENKLAKTEVCCIWNESHLQE